MNQSNYLDAINPRFLLWYERRFGAKPSRMAVLRARLLRSVGRNDYLEFHVPAGESRKAWVRSGTSDWQAYNQIFLDQQLNIPDISPGIIVDVGAYSGLSAIYFRQRYPESRVIAVEPNKSNYQALIKNVKHDKHILAMNAALWCENTLLDSVNPHSPLWAQQFDLTSSPDGIPTVTMPDLVNAAGGHIDMLKIDVEGAERFIFNGDCAWLQNVSTIVIEFHDWLEPRWNCEHRFLQAIDGLDFRRSKVGEHDIFHLR
ncbi:FkbM family methyltransferase [Rhodopirellula sp. JC740]|uniref:FkbM family methyltransferase n=1 Tax=Rhodopirellula halodulae TaxID=2894198 RepID=A0ABS8NDM6_9BACT|nr:FkbM family methyltransferase [Rhodopirellula sp. JC740]MCC9641665.1 FkbM family methyltransferase [Rhodopirellula sp. JC740]